MTWVTMTTFVRRDRGSHPELVDDRSAVTPGMNMEFRHTMGDRSRQITVSTLMVSALVLMVGCSTLASRSNTGVVVTRGAQIRSSSAVVAADLLEVNRGDIVDILDSIDIPDPSDNSKRELWYRVRAHDEERTEGWIEARNIMPEKVLE